MTLVSMTGFARGQGRLDGFSWALEVKSVNGKGLDMRMRLPPGFDVLEPQIKKLAPQYFSRGNFQLNLQIEQDTAATSIAVNEAVLETVLKKAQELARRLDSPPIRVEDLLGLRGVLETSHAEIDEDLAIARQTAIMDDIAKTFAALADMRQKEGAQMQKVIAAQIDKIEQLTRDARDCPDRQPEAIKARLAEQVEKLLEASSSFDPDRLHNEAILIATRADVQEELDRLLAHIDAARALLQAGEPVGRKFDFLAQEFNREANTLCSKAASQTLSHIGLEMKTTIDQLREQVQNIE